MIASTLALLAATVVVGTGPAFHEADKRATAYEKNPAAIAYNRTQLYPLIGKSSVVNLCAAHVDAKIGKATPRFTVVLSYRDGQLVSVFLDGATPLAHCVAERLAAMPIPNAPIADYAERLDFLFDERVVSR